MNTQKIYFGVSAMYTSAVVVCFIAFCLLLPVAAHAQVVKYRWLTGGGLTSAERTSAERPPQKHELEGRVVPAEFQESYAEQTTIDPTFATYKKLFQTFYLLVWSRVLCDQPEPFKKCIDKLAELVG